MPLTTSELAEEAVIKREKRIEKILNMHPSKRSKKMQKELDDDIKRYHNEIDRSLEFDEAIKPVEPPEGINILNNVYVCNGCIDGVGKECHTPECIYFLSRCNDLPKRETMILSAVDITPLPIKEYVEKLIATKGLEMNDRAKSYSAEFPMYPPVVCSNSWLYGIWMIGNNYKNKMGYYGEYPPSYLRRVKSLFPDMKDVLHLFSGKIEKGLWPSETTFDIKIDCDVKGDAHKLSEYFTEKKFDLILADPPYSDEDSLHYGSPMVNRVKVLKECAKIVKKGGFICWLDQVLPMYRKDEVSYVGTVGVTDLSFEDELKDIETAGNIGIIRSTNHRFRVLSIFRKV